MRTGLGSFGLGKILALVVLLCAVPARAQVTKAILNGDFLAPKSVLVKVPFTLTEFDVQIPNNLPGPSGGSGLVSQLIPPGIFFAWDGGHYFFWSQVSFGQSCKGTRRTVVLLKNGDERIPFGSSGLVPPFLCDEAQTIQVNGFVQLSAGEFVTLNVFQDAEFFLPIEARSGLANKTWVVVIRLP